MIKVAHIFWWRHDNRKQSASAREHWCEVSCDIPYSEWQLSNSFYANNYIHVPTKLEFKQIKLTHWVFINLTASMCVFVVTVNQSTTWIYYFVNHPSICPSVWYTFVCNTLLMMAQHAFLGTLVLCIWLLLPTKLEFRPNKKVCVFPVTCPKKLG